MGLENRDYLRESTARSAFRLSAGAICKWIIIANVAVFLLQNLSLSVQNWLELDPALVVRGQVWRLVTYSFCHASNDLLHILFNMLFVWWFGKALETMFGSREFLLFYLTAAIAAGLCFIGLQLFLGDLIPAIGASGAVMAIVMVYAMYYPRHQIYLMGILPLEIRWLVVLYVIFDGLPVLNSLAGHMGSDGIAHAAHLGGLAFGFLYKRHNLRLERIIGRVHWPRFDRVAGRRQNIRIYRPKDEETSSTPSNLDDQVDRILAKIHTQGEASLTNEERELLKRASRKYRNR